MNLADRLRLRDEQESRRAAGEQVDDQGALAVVELAPSDEPTLLAAIAVPHATVDPQVQLKARLQQALFERLGARLHDASKSDDELRAMVTAEMADLLTAEDVLLSAQEHEELLAEVLDDVLGYGPIEPFLADPTISEVMVNGTKTIFIERDGQLHKAEARFLDEMQLRRVIDRMVGAVGRRVDESSPMVDARLADGSRVNAIIPPLAVDGPSLTVRKFAREWWKADDLVQFGTMSRKLAELLACCVRGRLNILVSGGTGTGKTTLLSVLSSFIPEGERLVTIEDAVELRFQQEHVVRLESRPANIEGRGEVEIRDLLRNALRMRPDRIIIGEVRGGEALDMLQAMNTGHEGSLCTLHANSPRDALSRLETMVLMAGMDLPARAVREQVASALDLIVHITRLRDGTRRITHVTEVSGMEGPVVTLQDIFTFDYAAGIDDGGRFRGEARPTGVRPMFTDRLDDLGVHVPFDIFMDGGVER